MGFYYNGKKSYMAVVGSAPTAAPKEAYINITCNAFIPHSGAISMFCVQAPYANNTIVAGTVWESYEHFNLTAPVEIVANNDLVLTFSRGSSICTYTFHNVSMSEINGYYYYHCENWTITDSSGNTYTPGSYPNSTICSLLLKSAEA